MRRRWLATLAHAPREQLASLTLPVTHGLPFETLRAPQVGLAMLRGRIDAAGDRFNLGEATLSRCVLRLRAPDGETAIGVGYRLGRDLDRVRWMAQVDALLQLASYRADVLRGVIAPLEERLRAQHQAEARRTAASRVRFYTLTPDAAA